MGMVSTSHQLRCPAPHNVLGSNCWPLAGDSWRSANVTSWRYRLRVVPVPPQPVAVCRRLALLTHSHPHTVRRSS